MSKTTKELFLDRVKSVARFAYQINANVKNWQHELDLFRNEGYKQFDVEAHRLETELREYYLASAKTEQKLLEHYKSRSEK